MQQTLRVNLFFCIDIYRRSSLCNVLQFQITSTVEKDIQPSLQILMSAKTFALHSLGELKRSSHLIKLNFKVTPTSYLKRPEQHFNRRKPFNCHKLIIELDENKQWILRKAYYTSFIPVLSIPSVVYTLHYVKFVDSYPASEENN